MRRRGLAAMPAFLLIGACGGGGGGSAPPPPAPVNQPPAFTSSVAATAAESSTGVVYTAVATDPEGGAVSYSINGGPDAAAFTISPAGALRFVVPPDFDRPGDADGDNAYTVRIAASDGSASTTITVNVFITNVPDIISVRRVATGLSMPVALTAYPDGGSRVAVVEKAGRIRLLDPATGMTSVFLDVTAQVSISGDRGLLGLAFAKDYATSRIFYVFMTNAVGATEIRKYRALAAAQRPIRRPPTSS